MRKMKKFSAGGRADRAKARMDRRMADIEKDYKIALAKGKSEKEANAKRDQRIADTKDDYAKHTGADRTATRAAEKAAEARLTAARRSPDKDVKRLSVVSEGSKPVETKIDVTEKVETPRFDAGRPKPKVKAKPKPNRAPAFDMRALKALEAEVTRPGAGRRTDTPATPLKDGPPATPLKDNPPATPPNQSSVGQRMRSEYQTSKQAQLDELGQTFGKIGSGLSWFFAGKGRDKKAKGGTVKKYAKGGSVRSIDGIAKRGKTRAKRKK